MSERLTVVCAPILIAHPEAVKNAADLLRFPFLTSHTSGPSSGQHGPFAFAWICVKREPYICMTTFVGIRSDLARRCDPAPDTRNDR
jgi:hypothetical protein